MVQFSNYRAIALLALLVIFAGTASAQVTSAGYTDSLGSYRWFSDAETSEFTDSNGRKWFKVTDQKELWDEALVIREANIRALILLGFDSAQVSRDVFLYSEESGLFTKLSHLSNDSVYIQDWKPAFNSETWKKDARKTSRLKTNQSKTDLVLKFYPQKANNKNADAIGLNKKGIIKHSFEAGMEIFELVVKKISRNNDPHSDPVFDMHLRNSKKLLRVVESG